MMILDVTNLPPPDGSSGWDWVCGMIRLAGDGCQRAPSAAMTWRWLRMGTSLSTKISTLAMLSMPLTIWPAAMAWPGRVLSMETMTTPRASFGMCTSRMPGTVIRKRAMADASRGAV